MAKELRGFNYKATKNGTQWAVSYVVGESSDAGNTFTQPITKDVLYAKDNTKTVAQTETDIENQVKAAEGIV